MMNVNVVKRDGSIEAFNPDKIHDVLFWGSKDIKGVSVSEIEMQAQLQIHNNITTSTIHKILISSAVNLISEENPNYQNVASNLTNFFLRKEVFGVSDNLPSLFSVITENIQYGVYDKSILEFYTKEEIDQLDKIIKHNRDYTFTYGGIQQMIDKYLVQDRSTGKIYETPQFAFMLVSMWVFSEYDKNNRFKKVKTLYNDLSTYKISLPTPQISGIRTPNKGFSSCTLIDVDDTLNSIFTSNTVVGKYTASRAGIGLNTGRIRPVGSKVGNGEVKHTGVIPFLRMFQSTTRCCTQNGIRGGNSTTHFPFWHKEIEDIIVLKNNRGTDDNRVRHMDYSIQFNKLLYKRYLNGEPITLFNVDQVKDLYEAFFKSNEEFEELYVKYENDSKIDKKVISSDFFENFVRERLDTGRMYVMNADRVNEHSSFKEPIYMSNLCLTGETMVNVTVDNVPMVVRLDELCDLFNKNKNIKVLSKNVETNKISYECVTAAAKTSDSEFVYEIEDTTTRKKIKCTSEHKVFTKNRGYVMAKDLVETDELDIF